MNKTKNTLVELLKSAFHYKNWYIKRNYLTDTRTNTPTYRAEREMRGSSKKKENYLPLYIYIFFIDENGPCVGICFHNKQKAMEKGSEDYDKGWPMNAREFGPPCVGVCHYFRENNMTNPGYRFQHTGKIEINFLDQPQGEPMPSPASLPPPIHQNVSACICD